MFLIKDPNANVSSFAIFGVWVSYFVFLVTLNIHHTLYLVFALGCFSFVFNFKKINFKQTGIFLSIALLLFFIIAYFPVDNWDVRSIWSFHAKNIFYLQENELLSWFTRSEVQFSHPDYPKLLPMLSALFSTPLGSWREQVAIGSMAFLWAIFFFEVLQIKSLRLKCITLFFALVASRGQITAGLSDWLLSCYLLIGFLIYFENKNRLMDALFFILLPLLMKAEGLAISGLGVLALLFWSIVLEKQDKMKTIKASGIVFILPAICFLSWKYHCSKFGIHNYLTVDMTSATARLLNRLGHRSDWGIFFDCLRYYNKHLVIIFYLVLIRRLILWKKLTDVEIVTLLFSGSYLAFLLLTYFATPFDLDWHLRTSIDRTANSFWLPMIVVLLIPDNAQAKKI